MAKASTQPALFNQEQGQTQQKLDTYTFPPKRTVGKIYINLHYTDWAQTWPDLEKWKCNSNLKWDPINKNQTKIYFLSIILKAFPIVSFEHWANGKYKSPFDPDYMIDCLNSGQVFY